MENIETLKRKYKAKTSEALFGIEPSPEYQCPTIDKAIKDINDAVRSINNSLKELGRVSENESLVFDIDWELRSLETVETLEKLRREIEGLRAWGNEWKSFAKHLLERNENMESYVDEELVMSYEIDTQDLETKQEITEWLNSDARLSVNGGVVKANSKT